MTVTSRSRDARALRFGAIAIVGVAVIRFGVVPAFARAIVIERALSAEREADSQERESIGNAGAIALEAALRARQLDSITSGRALVAAGPESGAVKLARWLKETAEERGLEAVKVAVIDPGRGLMRVWRPRVQIEATGLPYDVIDFIVALEDGAEACDVERIEMIRLVPLAPTEAAGPDEGAGVKVRLVVVGLTRGASGPPEHGR